MNARNRKLAENFALSAAMIFFVLVVLAIVGIARF
jgi:hypothetical protein